MEAENFPRGRLPREGGAAAGGGGAGGGSGAGGARPASSNKDRLFKASSAGDDAPAAKPRKAGDRDRSRSKSAAPEGRKKREASAKPAREKSDAPSAFTAGDAAHGIIRKADELTFKVRAAAAAGSPALRRILRRAAHAGAALSREHAGRRALTRVPRSLTPPPSPSLPAAAPPARHHRPRPRPPRRRV